LSTRRDFTEGDVQQFFAEIAPFLTAQGVLLKSVEQQFGDRGYRITIDGRTTKLYSETEVASGDVWALTTRRTFGLVNRLLQHAASDERVYALYGGNDLHALFLTNDMYEAIRKAGVLPEREMPIPVANLEADE
jgi:hypothetical protein